MLSAFNEPNSHNNNNNNGHDTREVESNRKNVDDSRKNFGIWDVIVNQYKDQFLLRNTLNGIKHKHQLQSAKEALLHLLLTTQQQQESERESANIIVYFLTRILDSNVKDGVFVALGNVLTHFLIHNYPYDELTDLFPVIVNVLESCKEVLNRLIILNYIVSREDKINSAIDGYCLKDTWNAIRVYLKLPFDLVYDNDNDDGGGGGGVKSFFTIDRLTSLVDWNLDYGIYYSSIADSGTTARSPECFCKYPQLLTLAAKQQVLRAESQYGMRHELQDAFFRAIFAREPQKLTLLVQVHRHNLIPDAFQQLLLDSNLNSYDYRKQLKIHFKGEDGIDEGGLVKEFFLFIGRELFNPNVHFRLINEGRHLWFPLNTTEGIEEVYRLGGLIVALAIYNGIQMDLSFPMGLYKLLLDRPVSLIDIDPHMDHCIRYERPLYEEQCLQLYLTPHARMFVEGFRLVFPLSQDKRGPKSIIYDYAPYDIEGLVRGLPVMDWGQIRENAKYEQYTKDDQVIRWLWQVILDEFTDDQRLCFLHFVTGSDRLPISSDHNNSKGGGGGLVLTVVRVGPCSDRLPTAQTCFNTLLLNEYISREKLRKNLLLALEHSRTDGFGLC